MCNSTRTTPLWYRLRITSCILRPITPMPQMRAFSSSVRRFHQGTWLIYPIITPQRPLLPVLQTCKEGTKEVLSWCITNSKTATKKGLLITLRSAGIQTLFLQFSKRAPEKTRQVYCTKSQPMPAVNLPTIRGHSHSDSSNLEFIISPKIRTCARMCSLRQRTRWLSTQLMPGQTWLHLSLRLMCLQLLSLKEIPVASPTTNQAANSV